MEFKRAFNSYQKELIIILVVGILIGGLLQYAGKIPAFITDIFGKLLKKEVK